MAMQKKGCTPLYTHLLLTVLHKNVSVKVFKFHSIQEEERNAIHQTHSSNTYSDSNTFKKGEVHLVRFKLPITMVTIEEMGA